MDVSIIIVNWNSTDYLRECLVSITEGTKNVDFEVVVVDNASYDGSEKMIRREFPGVRFVQSHENGGFARANNLGFKHSSGKILLFLNPDTRIIGSAIDEMASFLKSTPRAGAVGPKLLYGDLSLQLHSVAPYPTILNQVLDIDFLKRRYPKWRFWGIKALIEHDRSPQSVQVVPGACVMVKREVFEEVGLFSEDYFMYGEDIDLCYKINQTDRRVYFLDAAAVIHYGGTSTHNGQASAFQDVLMRESVFTFIGKTKGRAAALVYRVVMSVTASGRLVLLAICLPWAGWIGRSQRLYGAVNKWKNILRWSIGLEKWARELR
ncbi:MAG: glycosyltransferase family 2 protein [Thermodesulfobacteriota bacterium]|jgi:hypothetical protein